MNNLPAIRYSRKDKSSKISLYVFEIIFNEEHSVFFHTYNDNSGYAFPLGFKSTLEMQICALVINENKKFIEQKIKENIIKQ